MIDRNHEITEDGNNYDAESSNVGISKRDASRLNNRLKTITDIIVTRRSELT